MRSKVLISAFVALAILFSFGMAEKASADSIMFPWLVKSPTVFTLVSVVNTSETSNHCATPRLHYQYWFKDAASATAITDACTVQSFSRQTSMNDIVSFDASGTVAGGAALFNDQPPLNGNVTYMPNSFAYPGPAVARAFLLVDNNNTNCFEDAYRSSMYGEAMIIEVAQGGAWGYVAFNGRQGGPPSEPSLFFNDETDMQGEVLRSPRCFDDADWRNELETTPTVLLPLNTFNTKMFVTPVQYGRWEYGNTPGLGARMPDANSRIEFCIKPVAQDDFPCNGCGLGDGEDDCQSNAQGTCQVGGIYDNDEMPMNSSLAPNVVCTGALDISVPNLLLSQAQIDYLTSNPGGQAWTFVRSMVGSHFPTNALGLRDHRTMSDSIVGKLEYSSAALSVEGTAVNGVVNDFRWIRNSGSLDNWGLLNRAINTVGDSHWSP